MPCDFSENPKFAIWISGQRCLYKNNKLSNERIQLLETIGFAWVPFDNLWKKNFEALRRFNKKYGNCNVPHRFKENLSLGNWVGKQRQLYKDKNLLNERIKLLEKIKFDWDPVENNWKTKLDALKKYKNEYGNCNVPHGCKENLLLSNWVRTQRQLYKNNKLSNEHFRLLEKLGFEWDPIDIFWEKSFEELKKYKKKNCNCNVPRRFIKVPKLADWVSRQRQLYKTNKLSRDRIKRLKSIGFVWDARKKLKQK